MASDTPNRAPLVVFQTAPYEGSFARSALDLAMSLAVFAQQPRLVFCGDSVLSLNAGQSADSIGRKSLRKVVDSLPLYDVDTIYVDKTATQAFGLTTADLPDFTVLLSKSELRTLIREASHVISL
ncbi:DsrE family protein [Congregibacter brevis]|uniref:DsrE family protein n=1 Tax=Congregibacter brevis TaxID=3081201 RepID=A0ABZ0IAI4_9GAMM|nr:DsrE family protein [Congregibacter sp. IMCC45268]